MTTSFVLQFRAAALQRMLLAMDWLNHYLQWTGISTG
jgi:hypothetical protein